MRTTNIRFTGLASGLDTESMVQAMVMPYKNNVDKAVQQQKLLELKKDAWKDMNNKIFKFYNETLNKLRLEGSFNSKEVTMSPPGLIDIGNKGSFPDGTHQITVENLAGGASIDTKKAGDINGDGKVDVTVTKETKLVSDLGIEKGIKITINGKVELEIDDDTTIKSLEDKFKEAGLSANFDEKAGAFFVSTKETGTSQEIKLEIQTTGTPNKQSADTILSRLGINHQTEKAPDGTDLGYFTIKGTDAKITYNGVEVTSGTNIVNVNGMEIKLLGSKPGEQITVVSKADTSATINMVKDFVNQYNALIDEINTKANASYNKDYLPLTDEQKKEMSDEDIKLWNEKVEASILRKDSVLQSITSSMRSIISDTTITVKEGGKDVKYSLASFGITTSLNYKEGGKLVIDEEKLTEMIGQHSDVFTQLFTQRIDPKAGMTEDEWKALGASGQKQKQDEAMAKSGIGVRLYADISERLKGSTLNSSNFLFNDKDIDQKIQAQKDQVTKLEDKMYRMEDLYYKQFASMEKMLSQLNNQSNWLMGQLGGM